MKIISPISKTVLNFWKKQIYNDNLNYRPIIYLRNIIVDDGVLLYNLMTNEIILITEDQYNDFINNKLKETDFFLYRFLITHWFVVPPGYNEKMMIYLYRNANYNERLVERNVNVFVVLTTTDCNARCYYCFELGAKRVHMTTQTAEDVAKYIVYKADPNKAVHISWFGGEPLYNYEVIDIISNYIKDKGLRLRSSMTSNGYLFNDELVDKAKSLWNLLNVQITLDGSENVYNKIKAYIYKNNESPFQTVINNIERLLKNGISVSIRLNISEKNYTDLYKVIDVLHERFKDYKNLNVYVALLYEDVEVNKLSHDDEHRKFLYNESLKLEKYMDENDMFNHMKSRFLKDISCHACMGDVPSTILISPEGNLGSCEHFVDNDFYGSIYDTVTFDRDYENLRGWKERIPEKEECNSCFYYPKCIRLKRCASSLNVKSKEFCKREYDDLDGHVVAMYEEYKKYNEV